MKKKLPNQSIMILAEGNAEIGMGHVARCLALGREFKIQGWDVYFVSNHLEGIKKIKDNDFDYFSYSKIDENERFNELINIVNIENISLVIVDSYTLSIDFIYKFRECYDGKIAYIDDLNSFLYPVDIIIHGSVLGQFYQYKNNYNNTLILDGLQYNLLRDEFRNLPPKRIEANVKEVLLTSGAGDSKNMTTKVINIFIENHLLDTVHLNVIVGSAFKNIDEINELSKRSNKIKLYFNPKSIVELMKRTDVAITAAGSTVYELFATGTPSVAIITALNQKPFVECLEKKELLINGGQIEDLDTGNLLEKLNALMSKSAERIKMSCLTQDLVDGYGAERVAQNIINYISS